MPNRIAATKQPQIPVPSSLGGGLMTVWKCGGPKPDVCSVPGCSDRSVGKCRFALLNDSGQTCGKPVCARHMRAGGVGAGCCPAHVRMLERRR